MDCEQIQNNQCRLTRCINPEMEFCLLACPFKHGHKPEESFDVYLAKKHGIKIGQTKPVKAKLSKTQTATTSSCSNELYVLLTHYFRQLCMACENNLHCDAKNFSKCLLKSSKWNTCPRGFWTEEMWNEAIKLIQGKTDEKQQSNGGDTSQK